MLRERATLLFYM